MAQRDPYDPLTRDLPVDVPGARGGTAGPVFFGRGPHGKGYAPQAGDAPAFGVYGRPRAYGPHTSPPAAHFERGNLGGGIHYGSDRSIQSTPSDYGGLAHATVQGPLGPVERTWLLPAAQRDHARRMPRHYRRSDERIRDDVAERLYRHQAIDAGTVSVGVHDGVVILSGSVAARRIKHDIEDVAAGVPGVRDVDNRLQLAPTPAEHA
jgi:hypothetical protein